MARHQVIVFIGGNCESIMSPDDLQRLNENFEKFEIAVIHSIK